jgi:hypothetical protein
MKWRVMMEVNRADGAVHVHEIGGGAAVDEYSPWTVELTLAEGKLVLAGLQHHLVQAQTEDHRWRRRRCQRCGAPRPIKDKRSRRLLSLFGTVNVSAPRFETCRCVVIRRQTLSPVSETCPTGAHRSTSGFSRRWELRNRGEITASRSARLALTASCRRRPVSTNFFAATKASRGYRAAPA